MTVGDKIYLHAKLNYRKFNWWHTQWAYAGVRDPDDTDYKFGKGYDDGRWVFTGDTSDVAGKIKSIPNLPIVVMAEDTASLNVIDVNAAPPDTTKSPLGKMTVSDGTTTASASSFKAISKAPRQCSRKSLRLIRNTWTAG